MKVIKESSNHQVIDSGTIIAYSKDADVTLGVELDEQFSFSIVLEFTQGSGDQSLVKNVSNNTITFVCSNFNNSLGTGVFKPIELATYKGKKVYFYFWVYALGDSKDPQGRKVDYTLYIEK